MSISKEKLDHYRDILQAIEDGDDIQTRLGTCPWEDWGRNGSLLAFGKNREYRRKPKPPKPVEGWINIYPDGIFAPPYSTKEVAERISGPTAFRTIFVREVDPNE